MNNLSRAAEAALVMVIVVTTVVMACCVNERGAALLAGLGAGAILGLMAGLGERHR